MKIAAKPLPFRNYIFAWFMTIAGLGLLAPLTFCRSTSGPAAMKIVIIGAEECGGKNFLLIIHPNSVNSASLR